MFPTRHQQERAHSSPKVKFEEILATQSNLRCGRRPVARPGISGEDYRRGAAWRKQFYDSAENAKHKRCGIVRGNRRWTEKGIANRRFDLALRQSTDRTMVPRRVGICMDH